MNLDWETEPAKKVSTRVSENVEVTSGQTLKIETTPDGIEVLNVECPEDETWNAQVIVQITVTATE
jgi:hypothetical protein